MKPVVHVELTGKAIKTVLLLLAIATAILTLVWLLISPAYAIAGGIGVVLLVRGLYALFTPSTE
ncbi:hypothetical protein GCM10009854_29160 [Saccharopolyspora halophila]|uniref:Uncharacterized protein n=1 Tax=Saccharopolyspora halophila TaxID=405551 RepID=A0ABP5TCI4_9PSEU